MLYKNRKLLLIYFLYYLVYIECIYMYIISYILVSTLYNVLYYWSFKIKINIEFSIFLISWDNFESFIFPLCVNDYTVSGKSIRGGFYGREEIHHDLQKVTSEWLEYVQADFCGLSTFQKISFLGIMQSILKI